MVGAGRRAKRLNAANPGGGHALFAAIADSAAGEGTGERLLRILQIPPDLCYLESGLKRSLEILESDPDEFNLCRHHAAEFDAEQLIREIREVLNALAAEPLALVDFPEWQLEMVRPDADAPHPLRSFCFSVLHHWVNLFFTAPGDGDDYDELLRAVSIYVLASNTQIETSAYQSFVKQWESTGKLPSEPLLKNGQLASRTAAASRGIRRLAEVEHEVLLRDLEKEVESARSFAEGLYACLNRESHDPDPQSPLNDIGLLLEWVHPTWERPHGGGGSGGGGHKGTARRAFGEGFVRIAESDLVVELLEAQQLNDREVIHRLRDRAAADSASEGPIFDDFEDEPWEMVTFDDLEPRSRKQASSRANLSRWAADRIRRIDFAHPLLLQRLTDSQLAGLARLTQLDPIDVDFDDALAITLILVVLSTGRPLDTARKLRVRRSDQPKSPDAEIEYLLDRMCWVVPADPPAHRDRELSASEREINPILELPDRVHFTRWLEADGIRLRDGLSIRKIQSSRRLKIAALLARVVDPGIRMSAIESFLFYRVLEESRGDLAMAMLITAKSHSHAASARHYSHYPADTVREIYRASMLPVAHPSADVTACDADGPSIRGFGAKRVPTIDAVRRLVADLRSVALRRSSGRDAHNAYNSYLLVGIALGVGYRAITDPALIAWNTATSMITWRDKAPTDYHRRIGFLPAILGRQLERHADYAAAVRASFGAAGASLENVNFFFFPDDDGCSSPEPYRPGAFERIAADYGLELYSLRRFMRTYLISATYAEPEDVDAWMGHWFYRVSPFDRLSTYPLQRLKLIADGPVARLLDDVGYRPIASPTAWP